MMFFAKNKAERRCDKGLLPETVCRYVRAHEHPLAKRTLLRAVRFVVFDTETTGLDVKKDKIISIGAVAISDFAIQVADSFETLIRQEASGDKESIPVHGILKKDLAMAATEQGALESFLSYIAGSVLVAHHAMFDIEILNQALGRFFDLKIFNAVIDTADFAKRIEKGPFSSQDTKAGDYSLDKLCERYRIPIYDRHTAPGDAFITAQLFQILLYHAEKKRILTLGEIL
ncbi:DNA polymerase III, epsilon subunit [Chloroherpeton thalassium ATCC 35110]|uniref:DNA polymerase III, epsilon subunit n=1 Tax=Chloroherpeton thalassium (strain ATCC 35110 / GB-78) TaxID=517418 RepID=B3QTA7_CHLT3|nr:3'-5' exonuclease [Chloroherpeton thalassium]ACF14206.1 DNA polymerase III, epsilon subunit [Chloroherpeton thalassium ATCC 35110]